ncbi:MAG: peptidylprolyl isomerase [Microthrixaceae bacterium]
MTDCPNPDGSSPRTTKFDAPPPMCIDVEQPYHAEIVTSMGTMFAQLLPKRAPKTVNNFVVLARYHYFEGVIFHRIIKGFVIQGGDPEGTGRGGPGYRFADELPQAGEYQLGSLVMANAGPDTNGSQFFVVSGPSGIQLPPNYSLFGKVLDGLDVLEEIQSVPTGRGDRPTTDVVIQAVNITEG